MKKVTLLSIIILALAMSASAQKLIDFDALAPTSSPLGITPGYESLNWSGIDYVAPLKWADAGLGFKRGPQAQVAFGGGPLCFPNYGGSKNDGVATKDICEATISTVFGSSVSQFEVDYAYASAGWNSNSITVEAYFGNTLKGSHHYNLTTNAQKLVFPNWGPITELKIYPSPGGSFVLYVVEMK